MARSRSRGGTEPGRAAEPKRNTTRTRGSTDSIATARGLALNGSWLDVAVDEGQGYWEMDLDGDPIRDPFFESTLVGVIFDRSPNVPVWDVESYAFADGLTFYDEVFTERHVVTLLPGIPVCDPATSGVMAHGTQTLIETHVFVTLIEPADGTPLDCPTALATGLDGALYVTDSLLPGGGGAQLVRLWPGNLQLAPEIVADLPNAQGSVMLPAGLALAPVSVPEPGVGTLSLVAAGALAGTARSRRTRVVALSARDRLLMALPSASLPWPPVHS